MFEPTPFRDRSRSAKIVLLVVVPAVAGAIAGVLLGASSVAYWVYAAIVILATVSGGFEHTGAGDAAKRGVVAGAVYGAALLAMHEIVGTHEKVSLGKTPAFLIVITAVAGMLLSALGGALARRRRESGAQTAEDAPR